jgi:hypothetical protein
MKQETESEDERALQHKKGETMSTTELIMSVEAQYAILDIVELGFRLSPHDDIKRWIYLPTTLGRPSRKPHLPGFVSSRAIEELKGFGFLDEKGILTDEGSAFYYKLRPNNN